MNVTGPSKMLHFLLWFIVFLVVTILLYLLTPLGSAHLVIHLNSDIAGKSQVYYRGLEQDFSEDKSVINTVVIGENHLSFAIPSALQIIRWDPPESSTLVVKNIEFKSGLIDNPVQLNAVIALAHIEQLSADNGQLTIVSGPVDPQLNINRPCLSIVKGLFLQIIMLLFISLIIVWVIALFYHSPKYRKKLTELIDKLC